MLAIDEDRLFHTEIAASTGNEYFVRILEFLGRYIIPRSKIRIGLGTDEERVTYLAKLQEEHSAIFEAIEAKEPEKSATGHAPPPDAGAREVGEFGARRSERGRASDRTAANVNRLTPRRSRRAKIL